MSVFAVNHLCREVLRDHAFRAAMKADPAKALATLDLTDAERSALLAGRQEYRAALHGERRDRVLALPGQWHRRAGAIDPEHPSVALGRHPLPGRTLHTYGLSRFTTSVSGDMDSMTVTDIVAQAETRLLLLSLYSNPRQPASQ